MQSILSVLGRTDFFDIGTPRWGTHWIYRTAAEVISIGFATFIAAGLANGRERAAAVIGGCAISFGFVVELGATYFTWTNRNSGIFVLDPWYQYLIDVLIVVGAPRVGIFMSDAAEDMHRDTSAGFGGINRLHFLWLWPVAFLYALGLITPLARIYGLQSENIIVIVSTLIVNVIPAIAVAVPGYYGLTFLAGHHGNTMHPVGRNLVGALVLVFGFIVGISVQNIWYWLMHSIYEAVFT